MDRVLTSLPLWGIMVLLLVGFPALTVGLQALIRRRFPTLKARRHNDVAGFLIAVIGVIYAVTVGFIIANQWENYTKARDSTFQEAFTLASIAEGGIVMGPAARARLSEGVVAYNQAVIDWWPTSSRSPATTDPPEDVALNRLLADMSDLQPTTPAQEAFVRRATEQLLEVEALSDTRLHQASRAHLAMPLWVVIVVSSGVTLGSACCSGWRTSGCTT